MTAEYPCLPHIPTSPEDHLSREQRQENLIFLADWIVNNPSNLEMDQWHGIPLLERELAGFRPMGPAVCDNPQLAARCASHCGTVHCIAGHAVAMAGEVGFLLEARHSTPCTDGPHSGDEGTADAALALIDPSTPSIKGSDLDLLELFFAPNNETATSYLKDLVNAARNGQPLPSYDEDTYSDDDDDDHDDDD